MATPPPGQVQLQLTHVDRADIDETFVDELREIMSDGLLMRLEFVVHRLDAPTPPNPPTGRALTASRLVMTMPAALQMVGKLQAVIAQMQKQGTLQQVPSPGSRGKPN